MTVEKKQIEMVDEFYEGLVPPPEDGLIRMEYYGDGIIPLLVDVEYQKSESSTDVDPGVDESATVQAIWHKGADISAIVADEIKEEIQINFLESGYGGEADEGDDDGQSALDRRIEEEFEARLP
jgi:hypothetical protein